LSATKANATPVLVMQGKGRTAVLCSHAAVQQYKKVTWSKHFWLNCVQYISAFAICIGAGIAGHELQQNYTNGPTLAGVPPKGPSEGGVGGIGL
jgi:hypothetical protein